MHLKLNCLIDKLSTREDNNQESLAIQNLLKNHFSCPKYNEKLLDMERNRSDQYSRIKVNESRTRDDPDIETGWQELKITTMLRKSI